jgi:hypothetical protein
MDDGRSCCLFSKAEAETLWLHVPMGLGEASEHWAERLKRTSHHQGLVWPAFSLFFWLSLRPTQLSPAVPSQPKQLAFSSLKSSEEDLPSFPEPKNSVLHLPVALSLFYPELCVRLLTALQKGMWTKK